MNLTLYIFSKKKNSTLRPSGQGTIIDVKLKNGTSLLGPVFLLSGDISEYVLYTYAYFEGRYYFITDTTIATNNIIEISCTVDVLASYRTEIGNYNCYIERSSATFDEYVYDNYLSSKTTKTTAASTLSELLPYWSNEGTFIVRAIGQASYASSIGITSYALSKENLLAVLRFLFTDSNFDFLADTSVKSFFNPFQYIVSVQWFPFTSLAFRTGTLSDTVKLGWWDSGIVGAIVDKTNIVFSVTCDLPQVSYSDFRRYSSNWTIIKAFIPGAGVSYLSPGECNDTIKFTYSIDIATGEALIKIFNNDTSYLLSTASGMMASDIAIGQLQTHEVQAGKNIFQGIGQLLTGNFAGLAETAIDSTIQMAQPTPCVNGSAGNMGAILSSPYVSISLMQYEGKHFPTTVLGRPCCRNLTINTIPGYIKCAGASLSIEGYDSERSQINSYLNGGFYYE